MNAKKVLSDTNNKDRKRAFIRLPFYLFMYIKAWNTKLQCLKFKCSSYSFYTKE